MVQKIWYLENLEFLPTINDINKKEYPKEIKDILINFRIAIEDIYLEKINEEAKEKGTKCKINQEDIKNIFFSSSEIFSSLKYIEDLKIKNIRNKLFDKYNIENVNENLSSMWLVFEKIFEFKNINKKFFIYILWEKKYISRWINFMQYNSFSIWNIKKKINLEYEKI